MKTVQTLFIVGMFPALSALSVPAWADGTMDHSKMGEVKMAQNGAAAMTDAEVRKVDMAQGKVTLRHGEIENLDRPPMTRVRKRSAHRGGDGARALMAPARLVRADMLLPQDQRCA